MDEATARNLKDMQMDYVEGAGGSGFALKGNAADGGPSPSGDCSSCR